MPADDVAGLVGDHSDDLVRRLGVHQRADVEEHATAIGHEGVEGAVPDENDLDRAPLDAGGREDRIGVVAQQILDLGVPDEGWPALLG